MHLLLNAMLLVVVMVVVAAIFAPLVEADTRVTTSSKKHFPAKKKSTGKTPECIVARLPRARRDVIKSSMFVCLAVFFRLSFAKNFQKTNWHIAATFI